MNQTNDLIARFVNATKEGKTYKGETTAYGKIVMYGDQSYVQLDGSDLLTPIVETTDVSDDDRVIVSLKNHTATVTNNITDPAVGRKRADGLESSITQTAEKIRLEVTNEVAQLEASITLTADQIRSEVTNGMEGLESSISQTASDIQTLVSDTASGLESKITQNANDISTLVENQEDFSEFKQTVEGFSFMNSGGTVKISHGDINLTGAITFSDLDSEVKDEIDDAVSTANSASNKADSATNTANSALSTAIDANTNAANANTSANNALYQAGLSMINANSAAEAAAEAKRLAENWEVPDWLTGTRIDNASIQSPTIIGGRFYAMGTNAWTEMNAYGLSVFVDDIVAPKIQLMNYGNIVQLVLGSGTYGDGSNTGKFIIEKGTTYASMTYYSGRYNGLACNLVFGDGTITAKRINPDGTVVFNTLVQ
jgi:TolA-binding protein